MKPLDIAKMIPRTPKLTLYGLAWSKKSLMIFNPSTQWLKMSFYVLLCPPPPWLTASLNKICDFYLVTLTFGEPPSPLAINVVYEWPRMVGVRIAQRWGTRSGAETIFRGHIIRRCREDQVLRDSFKNFNWQSPEFSIFSDVEIQGWFSQNLSIMLNFSQNWRAPRNPWNPL